MFQSDTIAAISTPFAVGGIGIVRVSGDGAKEVVSKIFRPFGKRNLHNVKGFNAIYGRIFDNEGDVDEVVVTVYNNPKSYTGEDVVEISCHGGLYITKRILRACLDSGARVAEPGEFTKRAFLNGKMTLTQAEAVMDVISSQGGQASKAALSAMDGAIYRSIKEITDILISIEAHLTAWVDYPDEGVEDVENNQLREKLIEARDKMSKLLNSYDAGKIFRNGVDTVIVGRPNVGKSTLMNMLSGSDKSIVTDIPGTTRDIVEDTIMLGDIVLNIADTAGIRDTEDVVEAVGVKLARKRLENSYFILAVFDSSTWFTEEDKILVDQIKGRPCVAVINKTDLERKMDTSYILQHVENVVELSADSGQGKEELSHVVKKILRIDKVDTSGAIVANERQRACLIHAQKEVASAIEAIDMGLTLDAVNVCVDYAVEQLMSLTGEKASEAIINQVFATFCVGK